MLNRIVVKNLSLYIDIVIRINDSQEYRVWHRGQLWNFFHRFNAKNRHTV